MNLHTFFCPQTQKMLCRAAMLCRLHHNAKTRAASWSTEVGKALEEKLCMQKNIPCRMACKVHVKIDIAKDSKDTFKSVLQTLRNLLTCRRFYHWHLLHTRHERKSSRHRNTGREHMTFHKQNSRLAFLRNHCGAMYVLSLDP